MKKIAVIFVFMFCGLTASAQLLYTIDEYLSNMYYKVNYDTAYIGRPMGTKWTLALRTYFNWTSYNVSGMADTEDGTEMPYKFHLRSEINPKMSIYGGYLGFGASLSRSYKKLIGQTEPDYSFKMNNYGNRFGFEFSLAQLNSLNGYLSTREGPFTIALTLPRDIVRQTSMYASFYYAINNKKFSYPAAFTHSYIQKRSAGSILLGGAMNISITTIGDSLQNAEMIRVINGSLGVGVGYAYNLVLPQDWLIHISALPYLIIGGGTRYRIDGGKEESSAAEFPETVIVGRAALIRTINRWFFGASGQLNYYNIECDEIRVGDSQWELIAFVGVRL